MNRWPLESTWWVAMAIDGACLAAVLSLAAWATAGRRAARPSLQRHGAVAGWLAALWLAPLAVATYDAFVGVRGYVVAGAPTTQERAGAAESPLDRFPERMQLRQSPANSATWAEGGTIGWPSLFGTVWAMGGVAKALSAARQGYRLRRALAATQVIAQGAVYAEFVRILRKLGIGRPVTLASASWAPSPFAVGWRQPVVVLPEPLAASNDRRAVRAVLLHELAHIRRGDAWANLWCWCTETLYWWNPLVALLTSELAAAREEICDDYVLAHGGDGKALAKFLIEAAAACQRVADPAALRLKGPLGSSLGRRVQRIVGDRRRPSIRLTRAAATTLIARPLAAVALATPWSHGWSEPAQTASTRSRPAALAVRGCFITQGGEVEGETLDAAFRRRWPDRYWIENELPGHVHRTLLAFPGVFGGGADQIPAGARIRSATLRLITDVEDYSGTKDPFGVYRVLLPWDPDSVTWQGFADGGVQGVDFRLEPVAWLPSAPDGGNQPVTLDLTQLFRDWSCGAPNYGVLLATEGDDGAFFHSEMHPVADQRPLLTIEYVPAPSRRALALTALAIAGAFWRRRPLSIIADLRLRG